MRPVLCDICGRKIGEARTATIQRVIIERVTHCAARAFYEPSQTAETVSPLKRFDDVCSECARQILEHAEMMANVARELKA